jgi:hypothetical protein
VQPKSGYKTITPIQVCNALWLLSAEKLSKRSLQVYFACFSLVAIREAAKRSHNQNSKKGLIPSYRLKELSRATTLSESAIKKELKTLQALNILSFSESEIKISKTPLPDSQELLSTLSGNRSPKRPIPVPRSILRCLSKCEKASTSKTLLAYLIRGLTLSRTGEITGKGSVKCSWIAERMNLSLRSVKSARKKLLEEGIITPDTGSHQWKLNRTGAYFTINLSWSDSNKSDNFTNRSDLTDKPNPSPKLIIPGPPVENSESSKVVFAPPLVKKSPEFAPPYKDMKTPYGSKDQKSTSGLLIKKVGGGEGTPTINNIVIEDLQSFYRTEELYFQAVKAKWISDSENSFLNFLAAAVRAKTLKLGDPVRVFVAIVKNKYFTHITQAEEDRARTAIKKFRYADAPSNFSFEAGRNMA